MKDLFQNLGLEVTLNDKNRLDFKEDVLNDNESVRSRKDLAIVAKDEGLELDDSPAYYMYRNVRKAGDEEKIEAHNQRFDLTVIPAGELGEEFIKTSGHYHPEKEGTGAEYPELYYVISGQATYLMQKHEADGSISDVIVSRVKAGEAIIMPLNYGHVTINELDEPLVMANWVEKNFKSEYGDFETKRGAAYFLLSDGNIEKNSNYENIPELREMTTSPQAIAELAGVPIYDYVNSLDKIDLIANPENHLDDFAIERLFRSK